MTNDAELIYLASPYYHRTLAVRILRYESVCLVAGIMMSKGLIVYSPIAHNHPIAMAVDLPGDWDFWRRIDLTILKRCDVLHVLRLDGFEKSVGIAAEIRFAEALGKRVEYSDLEDWQ